MKVCETTCIFMQQGRSRLFAQKGCNEINKSELRNSWSLREVITSERETSQYSTQQQLFTRPPQKNVLFSHGKQTPEMFATLKLLQRVLNVWRWWSETSGGSDVSVKPNHRPRSMRSMVRQLGRRATTKCDVHQGCGELLSLALGDQRAGAIQRVWLWKILIPFSSPSRWTTIWKYFCPK